MEAATHLGDEAHLVQSLNAGAAINAQLAQHGQAQQGADGVVGDGCSAPQRQLEGLRHCTCTPSHVQVRRRSDDGARGGCLMQVLQQSVDDMLAESSGLTMTCWQGFRQELEQAIEVTLPDICR